ncbi:MAG: hypothetical protein NZ837_15070 [Gammaproteobacteria bacterium]|jgi:hypothetical protein|nr:hypothetical protein [Gammaproteobacteria bacterium]MCH2344400.1 hypothetical protein [Pseudomonadales bacterium]MCS5581838.1 hypothetical protein [Gammaproteobacteria bacterium]MEE2608195.1 hypothetical protein [Pseudomonadota bacterium]MEE3172524.1 hypothetical protein [Pseudomonadota bacterium]|tara:strand:- start:88 stop:630 length:543 start_codon:yes stop_codon:yes gene_type:complete
MTEEQATQDNSKLKLILGGSIASVLAAGVIGFLVYSSICPCDRTPGGFLFGDDSDGQVNDWSFANDVELCQLQIYDGIRPHSINLNCMATPEGEMYLSCSVCDTKYWAARVGENERGVMRLDGVVYPVYLNRITDSATMDQAWQARVTKLQIHGGPGNPAPPTNAPRADRWWTFQVTSRG